MYTMKRLVALLSAAAIFSTAAPGHAAEDGVKIKRQFIAGKTYVMEMVMQQTSKTKVAGQDLDMDMKMQSGISMAVKKGEKEGQLAVTVKYDRISMEMKMAGQEMAFDSEKPEDEDAGNPLGGTLRKIAGRSFDLVVDEKMEVVEVKGLDELKEAMGPMGQMFGKETFSQMMKMADFQAPDRAVKPGEIWPMELKVALPGMGNLTLRGDTTYVKDTELDGVKCLLLEVGGVIKLAGVADEKKQDGGGDKPEKAPENDLGAQMRKLDMKMTGSFEGKITFDPALGYERRMDYTMTMNLSMKNPADPEARMTIPMKQKIVQTLKSVK